MLVERAQIRRVQSLVEVRVTVEQLNGGAALGDHQLFAAEHQPMGIAGRRFGGGICALEVERQVQGRVHGGGRWRSTVRA